MNQKHDIIKQHELIEIEPETFTQFTSQFRS